METLSSEDRTFLSQLNTMTGGDPEAQADMHEVGAALGLDRAASGSMAETLFMGGYAELKTLSGGIGITAMGLSELGLAPAGPGGQAPETLGKDLVLGETALTSVDRMLTDLKAAIASAKTDYETLDEAMVDIKTIEVQLLSPRPKTAVIREVFRSLSGNLEGQKFSDLRSRLEQLVRG